MTADQIAPREFQNQRRKYPLPDVEWLQGKYSYNPKTGQITNRHGKSVGAENQDGYLIIASEFQGKRTAISAHRIAFALMEGRWPFAGMEINHKDGNRRNNVWTNLEEVTQKKNQQHRYEKHRFRIAVCKDVNAIKYRVTAEAYKKHSFRRFCEAFRFFKEVEEWRATSDGTNAQGKGPAPKPKRDSRARVPRN